MSPKRGVYFLANDAILDQTIAFLNSFRTHNPAVPLCLVPFADDIAELRRYQEQFDFSIWTDADVLARCDEISRAFHDQSAGHYRKLAMWEGPFDEFVYIDADTVVLDRVDFVFNHLARFDYVASHSDQPGLSRWVWRDSIEATGLLTERQIGYSASTGFIASKRGFISLDDILAKLPEIAELGEHMALDCFEQPLINYLVVTSGRPYTSLFSIAMNEGTWDIPLERWGGDPTMRVRDGRVVSSPTPILLVHWAGEWRDAKRENRKVLHHDLWLHYRHLTPA